MIIALLLGLRHGVDPDHLAAIGDITAASGDRRSAIRRSSLYAAGHAASLLALCLLAVALGAYLPPSYEEAVSAVIGSTLIALGAVALLAAIRGAPVTKEQAIHRGLHKALGRSDRAIVASGCVHGIGAETPTQVALLAAAAGGQGFGIAIVFVAGLFASNLLLATTLGTAFASPTLRRPFALLAASYSIYLGASYL